MISIVKGLNWRLRQWRHRAVARGVLETRPVVPSDDGVILFSMIGTRVLLPFLVAAKSLRGGLGRGRFVVLDDGTLTAADRAALAVHLGDPEIRSVAAVDTGRCPRGGTWERLLTILDLRANHYVIQFDSDTVTCGPLPEVAAAIESGRSFTLRGEAGATLMPIAPFAHWRRAKSEFRRGHVQDTIETRIDGVRIPGLADAHYVRGCSGFAGFAPSGGGRALAEAFSAEAERLVGGERWREWGSEQVTSNFVIANEADPLLLPYDRYFNFWNEGLPEGRCFVHFIGTWRFAGGAYIGETRAAIERLHRAPASGPRFAELRPAASSSP